MQPRAEPGTWSDAPAFTVVQQEDGIDLQVVSPLACVRFITTPRQLPAIAELKPRLDSSLKVGPLLCAQWLVTSVHNQSAGLGWWRHQVAHLHTKC